MTIKQRFASNLLFLREKSEMTQQHVAKKIGIALSRYQHWERGRVLPQKSEYLLQLSDLFGVKVDDLLRQPLIEEQPA
ncbi:XRE family transcriptional regulator [Chitinophaga lutea]|uniref:XRE family transcriptional regulator n=1 Tax=Chitinophaga lutea TaxID=2488634 RepID=A0A3N4Q192_9BACT|nr:helix-turn-helix transcriptional regulator [Chitinophaga lutea]RPE05524.1 XRE family transcriptional regulator [Chitinophaga lutea]